MSRIRTLFSTLVPAMLAGGLIFGSAFGHAAGRDNLVGFWPAANDVTAPGTAKQGSPPPPPLAPAPPVRPKPPVPPVPPAHHQNGAGGHGGITISIRPQTVDGIKALVRAQLDSARGTLRDSPGLPKDVRDRVLERLEKVRGSIDKRLSKLDVTDLESFGVEMEAMGDEIERTMEGLDHDLSKLGDKLDDKLGDKLGRDLQRTLSKEFAKQFVRTRSDHDDPAEAPEPPDVDLDDVDDDDLKDALADLKDLALRPGQRDAIGKLRTDSDKAVAAAKRQLEELSNKLHTALGTSATSDVDIARFVDQISAQEATIRKARILAWVNARRVLDVQQRQRVENASRHNGK